MKDEYIHIDQNVTILRGESAREALSVQNDRVFMEEGRGIITVPTERWHSAQIAERTHWMILGITSDDDRNEEHGLHFDHYASIRGRSFHSAIELGCGPFSNLRVIARHVHIGSCTLLDPLVEDYLTHPHCRYDRRRLFIQPAQPRSLLFRAARRLHRSLPLRWQRHLRVDSWFCQQVPIERLISGPIETMPEDRKYDLIVMNNVIEHCYDIDTIFKKILCISDMNSVFIFHDKMYKYEEIEKMIDREYDAAHPLRADRALVDNFITSNYKKLYRKDVDMSSAGEGLMYSTEWTYFIGERCQSGHNLV